MKDYRKKQVDEKNDTVKTYWKGKESAKKVKADLKLGVKGGVEEEAAGRRRPPEEDTRNTQT